MTHKQQDDSSTWTILRRPRDTGSFCGLVAFALASNIRDLVPPEQSAGIVAYERFQRLTMGGCIAKIVLQNVDSLKLRHFVNWMRGVKIPVFDVTLHFHGCDLRSGWQGEPFDLEIVLPPGPHSCEIALAGVLLIQAPLPIGRGGAVGQWLD